MSGETIKNNVNEEKQQDNKENVTWDTLEEVPFKKEVEKTDGVNEESKEPTARDRLQAEVERENIKKQKELERLEKEIAELKERIDNEGKPTGTYREVGGDVYDNRYEASDTIKNKYKNKLDEARKLQIELSPQGVNREVERRLNDLRQEALVEKLHKEAMDEAVEQRLQKYTENEQVKEEAFKNQPTNEKYEEKIKDFVEHIPKDNIRGVVGEESFKVDSLQRRIEIIKNDIHNGKLNGFQKMMRRKDLEKAQHELGRYGADTDKLSKWHKERTLLLNKEARENYGKCRAENYKFLDQALNGKYGRDVKGALKRRGFKETPVSWDDKNFTSNEIEHMKTIAYYAIADAEKDKKE